MDINLFFNSPYGSLRVFRRLFSAFGRRIRISLTFALIAMFFMTALSTEAEENFFREPITEAGLVRMLPALKAEAREVEMHKDGERGDINLNEEFISMLDSVYAATEQIKSGELDPLECLGSYSGNVTFPPGVSYSPDASRIESALNGLPTVVFTFGIDASAFGRAVIGNDIESLKKMYAVEKTAGAPDSLKMSSVLETAGMFYRERNFIANGMAGPLAWSFTSPDSLLALDLYEANVLIYHGCTMLPTGPLIVISCRGIPGMEGNPKEALVPDLHALLERTGVGFQEYIDFKTALFFARDDARNPKNLGSDEAVPARSPEPGEVYEKAAEMFRTRKMNADLFLRYEKILKPLLSVLDGEDK